MSFKTTPKEKIQLIDHMEAGFQSHSTRPFPTRSPSTLSHSGRARHAQWPGDKLVTGPDLPGALTQLAHCCSDTQQTSNRKQLYLLFVNFNNCSCRELQQCIDQTRVSGKFWRT